MDTLMINKYNNKSICRVCLSSQEVKYMSLFEKYKCFHIFEYINILSNININESDGFPDKICQSCFFELETAINFKEKCENSNVLLKSQNVKIENINANVTIKTELTEVDLKLENEIVSQECTESFNLDYDQASDQDDKIHLELPTGKNEKRYSQVECHDCGGLFKSKCKLGVHWKKTHMLSKLICLMCKKTFKSYKAMHSHMKTKSRSCVVAGNESVHIEGIGRSRVYHCKECDYNTFRLKDMESHLRTHSGERPYICDLCPKKFTQQSSLQTHKEIAHKEIIVEITCQFCGKLLQGRNSVYRHLRTHEEKIQCRICKKFIIKGYYNIHIKRHSGVKSFTCEICAATFYSSAELCNHKRFVHKKGELYKCPKCDYSVVKSQLFKKHVSKHTDKNIPCTVCGRFFITPQKLSIHQRIHFAEKKIPCPACDKMFLYRDSMRRHLMVKHYAQTHKSQGLEIKINEPEAIIALIKQSP